MIDDLKVIIQDLQASILEANPLLLFEQKNVSNEGFLFPILDKNKEHKKDKNGKLLYKTPCKIASYKGLKFIIYETGLISLSGSLHKYFNDGSNNYNQFNINAVLWVLRDLKTKFDIEPEHCILKGLEIGINITPPIPTNEILDNCFLHKTLSFEHKYNSDEGNYKQWKHSEYTLKMYNKAVHYRKKGFDIDGEIMRLEIKYTTLTRLKERGIYTLQDLINYGLQNFKNELLNEWQNVLFFENTTRIDHLSKTIQKRLLEYSNPNYWSGLISNNQTENFKYHRRQLKSITQKNSNNIKDLITKTISEQIDFLNMNPTQIDQYTIPSIQVVNSNKVLVQKEPKNDEVKNSICIVTGFDISMQKDNSILLSHTGLRHYYKNDKNCFEQIKNRYLSKVWYNSDFDIQIKELAHNIRNTNSNQQIKQRRLYPQNQIQLFG